MNYSHKALSHDVNNITGRKQRFGSPRSRPASLYFPAAAGAMRNFGKSFLCLLLGFTAAAAFSVPTLSSFISVWGVCASKNSLTNVAKCAAHRRSGAVFQSKQPETGRNDGDMVAEYVFTISLDRYSSNPDIVLDG